MSTILGGVTSATLGTTTAWTSNQTGIHPLMNSAQMQGQHPHAVYPQEKLQRSKVDFGCRIRHAENGFVVEIGEYDGGLSRTYVAKNMEEVRDLITSDMVTSRMEGR